jgi:hypothetical protein
MRRVLLVLALSSITASSTLPAQQAHRFARWEPPRLVRNPTPFHPPGATIAMKASSLEAYSSVRSGHG